MELICYDGSTLTIKLDLVKQMPLLIFECVVRSKMLLQSFLKSGVGWKWRAISLAKWLFQRQMELSLSFKSSGWSPLPSRWVSIMVVHSLLPLNSVHLFCFFGLQLDWPVFQLPKCPHWHLIYIFCPQAFNIHICLAWSASVLFALVWCLIFEVLA